MSNRNFGVAVPRTVAMARPKINKTLTPATLRADLVSAQPTPPWRFAVGGVENGGNCGFLQLSPFSTPLNQEPSRGTTPPRGRLGQKSPPAAQGRRRRCWGDAWIHLHRCRRRHQGG